MLTVGRFGRCQGRKFGWRIVIVLKLWKRQIAQMQNYEIGVRLFPCKQKQTRSSLILLLIDCHPETVVMGHVFNRDGTRFQALRQNRVYQVFKINQKAPNVQVTLANIVTIHVLTSFQHDRSIILTAIIINL